MFAEPDATLRRAAAFARHNRAILPFGLSLRWVDAWSHAYGTINSGLTGDPAGRANEYARQVFPESKVWRAAITKPTASLKGSPWRKKRPRFGDCKL